MNIQHEDVNDTGDVSFINSPTEAVCEEDAVDDKTQLKSPKLAKEPQRYDELKIKDGPIYSWAIRNDSYDNHKNASSSNDSLCDSHVSSAISYRKAPLPAESTALLIVDVQPEYWSNCPAVRKDFPDFPKHLQKTIEICRQRRAKVIWVRADYNHKHSPWLSQFERIRGPRNLGEVPCDPSSPEFTWEEFATPEGGEVIIAKSSWSSTSNTALVDILKVACIETVLVCGLITSVCVQHSAFGIFEAGYRTLLVTDACADRGKARHDAALALYGDYMYELVTSEDLESKTMGLIPAEPVWLVMDEKTNMMRANSFPKHVISTSTSTNTVSTASSHTSTSSASTSSSNKNDYVEN
eukprot:CAMPEP_0197184558 /NCGR_PEP_ID=MMETSP1423-20130617/10112_1 /TAXON_ID=476441 /ORGANISM="Pseudo-nitzschia heimii, Strain UNC1101" /LENGTH=352 /DNA_ID=CAMNT_0042635397 /DNA_START=274 /DNA_END=1335 /DNA_ORIENTATION=-